MNTTPRAQQCQFVPVIIDSVEVFVCEVCGTTRHKKILRRCTPGKPSACRTKRNETQKNKKTKAAPPALPSLPVRAVHYTIALWKWWAAGKPTRTEREIRNLEAICQGCDQFNAQKKQCAACGCGCGSNKKYANKLAMRTEECPLGKW